MMASLNASMCCALTSENVSKAFSSRLFTSGVVSIFEDIFVLTGILIIMLFVNWRLALITFSVLPFIAIATKLFRDRVRDSYRRIRVAVARINAHMQEHVSGMMVLQLFISLSASTSVVTRVTRRPTGFLS
ncbi:MAG: hypothetical protein DMG61_03615 [Acidobacteria bacterium]|nr:MAG: hypothetical protein DMG61_03615 [Acidobacteriota bacterium]